MEERKSLGKLLGETFGFTTIVYPIYSGLYSLATVPTFVETLKDPETLVTTAGLGIGLFILNAAYELTKS